LRVRLAAEQPHQNVPVVTERPPPFAVPPAA